MCEGGSYILDSCFYSFSYFFFFFKSTRSLLILDSFSGHVSDRDHVKFKVEDPQNSVSLQFAELREEMASRY